MPSPPRDAAPGIFHINAHSVRSTELFRDDIDRMRFLTDLAGTIARYGWTCIEVCLLTTHYHMLIETFDESLPLGMHRLNFRHACRYNSRHRLRGHVFDAPYFSDRITSEAHLLAAYAYIARNPVDAGLCDSCEAWPWSSHSTLCAGKPMTFVDASRVLGCFGDDPEVALERLRAFVDGLVTVL
jgi:REP element-mobilizing transposase RayT